jgi:hypothetical protein
MCKFWFISAVRLDVYTCESSVLELGELSAAMQLFKA